MPRITLYETAMYMADRLIDKARLENVDLQGIKPDISFNGFLDDAFQDGGEVRCEHFADLAWTYAGQFGPLESEGFEQARWDCIIAAIREVNRRLK